MIGKEKKNFFLKNSHLSHLENELKKAKTLLSNNDQTISELNSKLQHINNQLTTKNQLTSELNLKLQYTDTQLKNKEFELEKTIDLAKKNVTKARLQAKNSREKTKRLTRKIERLDLENMKI